MQIEQNEFGDVIVLRVDGDVVGAEVGCALSNALGPILEAGKRKLVLDLAEVQWINSTGLGTLVAMVASIRRRNGDLRLAHINSRVDRLLQTTKVGDMLLSFDDVGGALASFA